MADSKYIQDPTLAAGTGPIQNAASIFLDRYHQSQFEDFLANEHAEFTKTLQQAAEASVNMEDEEGASNGFKIYQSAINNYLTAASRPGYTDNPYIAKTSQAIFSQATKQLEQMTAARESVVGEQKAGAAIEASGAATEASRADTSLTPAREGLLKAQTANQLASAQRGQGGPEGQEGVPLTPSGLYNKVRRQLTSPASPEEGKRISDDLASIRREKARALIARKIAGKQKRKDDIQGPVDWTYSDEDIARAANEINRDDVRNQYVYSRMEAEAGLHGVHPTQVRSQYEHLVNPYRNPEYAEPIDRVVTDHQLLTAVLGLNTMTDLEAQQANVNNIEEIKKRLPDHPSKFGPGPVQDIFEEIMMFGGDNPNSPGKGFSSVDDVRNWLSNRAIQKIEQIIGGEGVPASALTPGGKKMRDKAEAFSRQMIYQYLPLMLVELQELSGTEIPGAKKAIESAARAIKASKKEEPKALDFGPISKKVKGVLGSILGPGKEDKGPPLEEVK